jgi:hypothetical protein
MTGVATNTFNASIGTAAMISVGSIQPGVNNIGTVNTIEPITLCAGPLVVDIVLAYTNGNVLATLFICTNAVTTTGGKATLKSFQLISGDDVASAFQVFLFSQPPASLTALNTLWQVSTADLDAYGYGPMNIGAEAFVDLGTNQVFATNNVGLLVKAATNDVFLAIRWTGTVAATNTFHVKLGFIQD